MRNIVLTGGDYSRGENSKDEASSLSEGEASLLVNLLPGRGTVYPRAGCGPYTENPLDSILDVYGTPESMVGSRLANYEFYGEKIVFVFNPTAETITAHYEDGRVGAVGTFIPSGPTNHDCFEMDSFFVADGLMFFSCNGKLFRMSHDRNDATPHLTWRVDDAQRSYRGSDTGFNKWYAAQLIIDDVTKAPVTPLTPIVWGSKIDQTGPKPVEAIKSNGFLYGYYLITYVSRPDIAPGATSTQYGPVIFESRHTREDTRLCQILKAPLVVMDTGLRSSDLGVYTATSIPLSTSGAGYSTDLNFLYRDTLDIGFRDTPTMGSVNVMVTMPRSDEYDNLPAGVNPFRTAEIDQGAVGVPIFAAAFSRVTHMRIYRTLFYPSIEQASGAPLRFLVDIPIENARLGAPYVDLTTDDELLGSLYTYDLFSAVDLPIGEHLHFFKGKAWSISDGKIYASVPPINPVLVSRWLPYCNTSTDWFTTAVGNSDKPLAVADDKENLIAFAGDSVWALLAGDLGIGPQKISDELGILGRRCYSKTDLGLVFLSKQGPSLVDGMRASPFDLWKHRALHQPRVREQTMADFTSGVLFNCNESLIADSMNGQAVAGLYIGPTTGGRGGYSIEYANSLAFVDYCQFSDQVVVGLSQKSASLEAGLVKVFDRRFSLDMGNPFTCRARSMDYRYQPTQWERSPSDDRSYLELLDFSLDAKILSIDGQADFGLAVNVDGRYRVENTLYTRPDYDSARGLFWESDLLFGFKEGVCGRRINFEWFTSTPDNFTVYGFSARAYKVQNPIPRFTVSSGGVMTLLSTVPELVSGYQFTDSMGPEIV